MRIRNLDRIGVDLHIHSLDGGEVDDVLLSPDERERAKAFVFPIDSRRYRRCRLILRRTLGSYLGQRPEDIRFQYGYAGKPTIDGDLCFNLSHSGDIVAFAIARFPVGIDIEAIRPLTEGMENLIFSAADRERWLALPESERQKAMIAAWTRKEAVVKADGDGFQRPPDEISVTFEPHIPARVLSVQGLTEGADEWSLSEFLPAENMLGVVAARRPKFILNVIHSDPDSQ